jgi:hypothetical protein
MPTVLVNTIAVNWDFLLDSVDLDICIAANMLCYNPVHAS